MGGNLAGSRVVQGMVFGREPEGNIKKATKAKVAVFTSALDITQTETKGTVLIHNADEMLNFTRGEEKHLEKVCPPTHPWSLFPSISVYHANFIPFEPVRHRLDLQRNR